MVASGKVQRALAIVDGNNSDNGSNGTILILPLFSVFLSINKGPVFVFKIVARKCLLNFLMDNYCYKHLHF